MSKGVSPLRYPLPEAAYYDPAQIACLIKRGFATGALGSILKRQSLVRAGGLREDLRWYSDWFAVHVIGCREGLCLIPTPVAIHRMSSESYSTRAKGAERKRAFQRVFNLLSSPEYADVREAFRSGTFHNFGWPLLKFICRPDHWLWMSIPYLRLCARQLVRGLTPVPLRRLYRNVTFDRDAVQVLL